MIGRSILQPFSGSRGARWSFPNLRKRVKKKKAGRRCSSRSSRNIWLKRKRRKESKGMFQFFSYSKIYRVLSTWAERLAVSLKKQFIHLDGGKKKRKKREGSQLTLVVCLEMPINFDFDFAFVLKKNFVWIERERFKREIQERERFKIYIYIFEAWLIKKLIV